MISKQTRNRILWTVGLNAGVLLLLVWTIADPQVADVLRKIELRLPGGTRGALSVILIVLPSVGVALVWFPESRDGSWQKGQGRRKAWMVLAVVGQTLVTLAYALAVYIHCGDRAAVQPASPERGREVAAPAKRRTAWNDPEPVTAPAATHFRLCGGNFGA